MTPQELLQPRFKVITDYPNSPYSIGDIYPDYIIGDLVRQYPHIFKPLQWWEERKIEDMPTYFKGMSRGDWYYLKSNAWEDGKSYPCVTVDGITCYAPYCEPISENEYLEYKNKKD